MLTPVEQEAWSKFGEEKASEEEERERLKREIGDHASDVFTPEHRNAVKELCVFLGHVHPIEVERLGEVMSNPVQDPLDLFKSSPHDSFRSRFDVLFDYTDTRIADIRTSNFLSFEDTVLPKK